MSIQRWLQGFAIVITVGCAPAASARQADQDQPAASDNTKVNRRDRQASEPTADQGKNNASDRELMRRVRRAIVADKALSTYAHNVKIIAENGRITLKGPVRSEQEKQTIESKAVEAAGASNVVNELTIKPRKAGASKHEKPS
jgi:hyperosmotically inducible protein